MPFRRDSILFHPRSCRATKGTTRTEAEGNLGGKQTASFLTPGRKQEKPSKVHLLRPFSTLLACRAQGPVTFPTCFTWVQATVSGHRTPALAWPVQRQHLEALNSGIPTTFAGIRLKKAQLLCIYAMPPPSLTCRKEAKPESLSLRAADFPCTCRFISKAQQVGRHSLD